jgi:hypothetical protein
VPQHIRDLTEVVFDQIPAQLKKEVGVQIVDCDAYCIRVRAKFVVADGRSWECNLVNELVAGVSLCCKIPEEFLAQLCAIV